METNAHDRALEFVGPYAEWIAALGEEGWTVPEIVDAVCEREDARRLALFGRRARPVILRERHQLESAVAQLVGQPAEIPETARGLTEPAIRRAAAAERRAVDGHPTRTGVAARLNTSESTLKRAMRDLGMGPWPPAAEDDPL